MHLSPQHKSFLQGVAAVANQTVRTAEPTLEEQEKTPSPQCRATRRTKLNTCVPLTPNLLKHAALFCQQQRR